MPPRIPTSIRTPVRARGSLPMCFMLLGARTVELQIALTVFTVGLLAFWFVYRFLADVSTRLYAMVACLLLMTDYIMFAQWHIGLWHIWKTFLLFGGLYLAHRVADKEQSRPLLVVYVFHAFLFYYETIFNVYVAAVCSCISFLPRVTTASQSSSARPNLPAR